MFTKNINRLLLNHLFMRTNMKFLNAIVTILIFNIILQSCTKPSTENKPIEPVIPASKGLLVKVIDSLVLNLPSRDTFIYDDKGRLTSMVSGYTYSFFYNANGLERSFYNGGVTADTSNPYARTEYTVTNNVLKSSRYYFGRDDLTTTSTYVFNNNGLLSSITQTQINGSLGSYETFTNRFEYDADSNLIKVYYKSATQPEALRTEYLNYDKHENPYYKLPWTFDYTVFLFNDNRLSKHNVGKIKYWYSPIYDPTGVQVTDFFYEYNSDQRVSKMRKDGEFGKNTYYYFYR